MLISVNINIADVHHKYVYFPYFHILGMEHKHGAVPCSTYVLCRDNIDTLAQFSQ